MPDRGGPGSPTWRAARRADLLRLLPRARHPLGFGWLDDVGRIDPARPVELWITCRMTHVASLALLAGEGDGLAEEAAHGVRALTDGGLHDAEHGGWFGAADATGPTDDRKQAYGHAFVVLAGASATTARVPGGEALLGEALAAFERFWEEPVGLPREEFDRAWTTPEEYRGLNATMHALEALLAASEALDGEAAALQRDRARRIAHRVAGWAHRHDGRLPEHHDAAWRPLLEHHADRPDDPFRPYGATVGHGLEWSRLLLATRRLLGDPGDTLIEAGRLLFDRAVADGWAVDGADGFVYTTDWTGRPVVRARMHWVVAEALAATHAWHAETRETRFADLAARWWQHAAEVVIDPADGSWRHELDERNRPSARVWSGRPDLYHAYQALHAPDLGACPSYAGGLLRRRS